MTLTWPSALVSFIKTIEALPFHTATVGGVVVREMTGAVRATFCVAIVHDTVHGLDIVHMGDASLALQLFDG